MKKYILHLGIAAIILVFGAGVFYWYEWRPSQIRATCTWVKKHEDAKPAIPSRELPEAPDWMKEMMEKRGMEYTNIEPAQPAQPAKDWIEPASQREYENCLHQNGL